MHPQTVVDAILEHRAKEISSSLKQRVADSTSAVQSRLPANVWSIKTPRVFMVGTELSYGEFVNILFVSGTKTQVKEVARIVTHLPEGKDRTMNSLNWKVDKGVGEEYVIDAQKFLANARKIEK